MSLIIETGSGVRSANAYVNSAYVTSYLTDRGNQTENGWSSAEQSVKDSSIIQATDYVEKKYSHKFLGLRKFTFTETSATGSITFSGLPVDQETLTVGDETYKFVSSLSGAAFEVLIGSDSDGSADNLYNALKATSSEAGISFGNDTEANRHAAPEISGSVITLTANSPGLSGEYTVLSGSVSNVSLSAFSGARDGGSQRLSWPRDYAYDKTGNLIEGIPNNLKQAVSEYAVRSIANALMTDPSFDAYGGSITRRYEKVGPIEEEVVYSGGSVYVFSFKPYPEADELIKPLLKGYGTGGVIRG